MTQEDSVIFILDQLVHWIIYTNMATTFTEKNMTFFNNLLPWVTDELPRRKKARKAGMMR